MFSIFYLVVIVDYLTMAHLIEYDTLVYLMEKYIIQNEVELDIMVYLTNI